MTVTVGTDPELFLRDSRTGGVVPVCGLVGGEKGAPLDLKDGYGVQEDNVMLEFNTPPAKEPYEFFEYVGEGVKRCADLIRVRYPHLEFDTRGERLFGHAQLQSQQAMRFGCSPDFDAYSQGAAIAPVDPSTLREEAGAWRFAGGHVHLGYQLSYRLPEFVVASFADVFLGLAAVGEDKQPKRRALYGAPGRYRPTKYGIEYRVLSNFWVLDPTLRDQVSARAFSLGAFIENAGEARIAKAFKEIPWADVQRAIATEDDVRAADLLHYLRNDLGLEEIYG